MNLKYFFITLFIFLLAQVGVWIQLNGQFFSEWMKKHPFLISLTGIPITYLFIMATSYGRIAFDGLLWPQRFLGFSVGIVIYAVLTYLILNEGMSMKTILSLLLAVGIIFIQVVIK